MEEAAKQRIKSTAGHLKWMPRRFAPHRIFVNRNDKSEPIPHLEEAFGLSWIGARAHFRTCGSGSGKAVSPKHWHDQLLQYSFSTHHKTNSPLEALFFCVIADFNFPVLHKYHSSASGLSIPSETTPSIISVTT